MYTQSMYCPWIFGQGHTTSCFGDVTCYITPLHSICIAERSKRLHMKQVHSPAYTIYLAHSRPLSHSVNWGVSLREWESERWWHNLMRNTQKCNKIPWILFKGTKKQISIPLIQLWPQDNMKMQIIFWIEWQILNKSKMLAFFFSC